MRRLKFTGLMAPVFTPFKDTAQYELDLTVLPAYLDHLTKNKIKGILVNGTAGEGMSMTTEERKRVLEGWMKEAKPLGVTVMAQVGGGPLVSVKNLCKHAESLEVDALLCLPDLYFKPKSVDELTEYLREVGSAAPTVPLLYYHIPSFTKVDLDMGELLSKCGDRVPNFSGIKFTHVDMDQGTRCVQHSHHGYSVFLGADQITAGAWAMGFNSAISTTLNMYPQRFQMITEAIGSQKVESALKQQLLLNKHIEAITSLGSWVASMKSAMQVVTGLEMGPPRPPLSRVPQQTMEQSLARLQ